MSMFKNGSENPLSPALPACKEANTEANTEGNSEARREGYTKRAVIKDNRIHSGEYIDTTQEAVE